MISIPMKWWQRALLFAAFCLVVTVALCFVIPVETKSGNGPRFFYIPGVLVCFPILHPAMDPDWNLLFMLFRIGSCVAYSLVGFIVGALCRKIWLAGSICLAVFALAVVATYFIWAGG